MLHNLGENLAFLSLSLPLQKGMINLITQAYGTDLLRSCFGRKLTLGSCEEQDVSTGVPALRVTPARVRPAESLVEYQFWVPWTLRGGCGGEAAVL